jgi:hypothetical protein
MTDEFDPLEGLLDTGDQHQDTTSGDAGAGADGAGDLGAGKTDEQPSAEAPSNETDQNDTDGQKMVPYAALAEARRRAEAAEARLAERGAAPQEQQGAGDGQEDFSLSAIFGERPDPKEDLEGYLAWKDNITNVNLLNQTLNVSERMARKELGKEFIDKVREWGLKKFETDPVFTQQVLGDPDPYEVAVRLYNEEQEIGKLRELPEEVRKGLTPEELKVLADYRAAQAGGGSTENGQDHSQPRGDNGQFRAAPAKRSPQAPSRSIAGTRDAGKTVDPMHRTSGPGVAVDDAFGPG